MDTPNPIPNPIRAGAEWKPQTPDGFTDVRYDTSDGIAKITICRPEVRNAFRPRTLFELRDAFEIARDDPEVGVILFTGEGPDAFCSGGDQRVRGDTGYLSEPGKPGRFHVTDLHGQRAGWRALAIRYVVATCSLALAGLGFWWAWIDRDRLTWHDRASHTRMQLAPKRA